MLFAAYEVPIYLNNYNRIHAIVSDNTYSFNDKVISVKYNYGNGFIGIGENIISTTVTVANGTEVILEVYPATTSIFNPNGTLLNSTTANQITLGYQVVKNFAFQGNLGIIVNEQYTITYEVIIHADNETELKPLLIVAVT